MYVIRETRTETKKEDNKGKRNKTETNKEGNKGERNEVWNLISNFCINFQIGIKQAGQL
jgi:hypothetical protein